MGDYIILLIIIMFVPTFCVILIYAFNLPVPPWLLGGQL